MTSWQPGAIYDCAVDTLPAGIAATLDRLVAPLRPGWHRPLNGQARRREMMSDLIREVRPTRVIETGTFRGATAAFLRQRSGVPVTTVEFDHRKFLYCTSKFRCDSGVEVLHGDSAQLIPRILDKSGGDDTILCCLDAHWGEHLPLAQEVQAILTAGCLSAVVIDDFAVPDDAGYRYDDYGDVGALTLELLPWTQLPPVAIWWPAAPSGHETGWCRGCVVLCSPGAMEERVARVETLRRGRRPRIGGASPGAG